MGEKEKGRREGEMECVGRGMFSVKGGSRMTRMTRSRKKFAKGEKEEEEKKDER